MSRAIEEILAPKPGARPRISAHSIADKAHAGLLKVGQTMRDVKQRLAAICKKSAPKGEITVVIAGNNAKFVKADEDEDGEDDRPQQPWPF